MLSVVCVCLYIVSVGVCVCERWEDFDLVVSVSSCYDGKRSPAATSFVVL